MTRALPRFRYRRHDDSTFLYVFDLIELNGDDLRREPIEHRKAALAKLLRHAKAGLVLNDHIDEPGDVVFRSRHRVKSKNPAAPAVKREAEEDWRL